MLFFRRALNRDGPVIVRWAGAAPAPVALVTDQRHPAVIADAVVAAGLTADRRKAAADRFGGELPHHTMGRQPVDGVVSRAVLVGTDDFAVN